MYGWTYVCMHVCMYVKYVCIGVIAYAISVLIFTTLTIAYIHAVGAYVSCTVGAECR